MSVVMIIALALVAISVFAITGETIQSVIKSKAKLADPADISALKSRISALEAKVDEREASLLKIQDEVRFVTRMLEDKSGR